MNRLLLIDGHALAFRAYYAFAASNLTNSLTGNPSGAVFGFWRMFFKLIQDEAVSHIAFCFDPGTKLKRNDLYPDYKANRKPMPEDLRPQLNQIFDMVKELGFPVYKLDGEEADDIIGTICKKFAQDFEQVLILSSDKDLYQVLEPNILMLRGKRGVSEFEKIDPIWVEKEIGVTKDQIPDYMGIVGDTSDNIPGVKGIGEKGAAKLIQEFQTLDNLYKRISDVTPSGIKEKLISNKANAFLSRELATIQTDLSLGIKKTDLTLPNYLSLKNVQFFKEQGFNVLHKDLAKLAGISIDSDAKEKTKSSPQKTIENSNRGNYTLIKQASDLKKVLSQFDEKKFLSIDTETTSQDPNRAEILGVSFSWEEGIGYYVAVSHPNSIYSQVLPSWIDIAKILKPFLENPKIPKVGQNIKYDYIVFNRLGINLTGIAYDTMLGSYLLKPGDRKYNMDDLALTYLDYKTITYEELVGSGKNKIALYDIEPTKVADYAGEDADITLRLFNALSPKTESWPKKILEDIELPLIEVLAKMEMRGVLVDGDYFQSLSKQFEKKIQEHQKQIYFFAGREFNINSTKELQSVLFEDLRLPTQKKTQTGFSTDHSVLESLQGAHPIIDDLLAIRKFSKLKSTYSDALPELIHPETHRIHTSYNQTIAATGRLSSTNPNLQNIPIKDEEGKLLRKGFIAPKGFELLSLDYSQIELRIMAHFSKDISMLDAYRKNLDIHRRTAAGLFGISEDKVTPEMRNKAKIVNFSVIYGVTAFGLAENLKIPRGEAKEFIDRYFAQYPGVKDYMEETVTFCKKNGYVETLIGRRRYLPELNSTNKMAQEGAKRVAINSPIQGTSADMIKIAMLQIQKGITRKGFRSGMILQVHDELVFEVDFKEKEEFLPFAKKCMEEALPLTVPIKVEGKFGKDWALAH